MTWMSMNLNLPEHTDAFSCAGTFSFNKAESRFAWTGCFCIFGQPYWLLALLAINFHFFEIGFLNVWIDLVIPNMENTSTSTTNDLPEWITEPQTPKPQADGVVMVRYPRLPLVSSWPIPHVPSPVKRPQAYAYPVTESESTSKKRKITCPTHSDWVNGLKFFNNESDNLYTIAGTKDAIKNFTELWE